MKKKESQRGDYIDLSNDGRVVLYKRQNLKSPKWQVRIRVPNASGYRVQSTKTSNQREAERFALDLYEELYIRVKQGGSLVTPKIKTVIDEWVTHLTHVGKGSRGGDIQQTISTIHNYFYRYVKDERFTEIDGLLRNYWSWRSVNYLKSAPSIGTLKREQNALRSFLAYAKQAGHIERYALPRPPSQTKSALNRPTFTIDEWRQIYTSAKKWIQDGKKSGHYDSRAIAYRYFMLLANSGMRVGEARMLKWEDIQFLDSDDGIQVVATVSGKTGSRDVVFQPKSEMHFKHLWQIYRTWDSEIENEDQHKRAAQYVFQDKSGNPIKSFKKTFHSLLAFANVPKNKGRGNRTIYSIRHFYATMRLSNNVSPFILAKQMGTSVEMLEKYYGQIITKDLANQITNMSTKQIKHAKILT